MVEAKYRDEAVVQLSTLDRNDKSPYPYRQLLLSREKPTVSLGRASRRKLVLEPGPNNGYFDCAVMSRNHAMLRLEPDKQQVSITDTSSLHGTMVNKTPLGRSESRPLNTGDVITFGTPIERGIEVFSPYEVEVKVQTGQESSQNRSVTYRVPDDSDVEEISSDDEPAGVEVSLEILREQSRPTNNPVPPHLDHTMCALPQSLGLPRPTQAPMTSELVDLTQEPAQVAVQRFNVTEGAWEPYTNSSAEDTSIHVDNEDMYDGLEDDLEDDMEDDIEDDDEDDDEDDVEDNVEEDVEDEGAKVPDWNVWGEIEASDVESDWSDSSPANLEQSDESPSSVEMDKEYQDDEEMAEESHNLDNEDEPIAADTHRPSQLNHGDVSPEVHMTSSVGVEYQADADPWYYAVPPALYSSNPAVQLPPIDNWMKPMRRAEPGIAPSELSLNHDKPHYLSARAAAREAAREASKPQYFAAREANKRMAHVTTDTATEMASSAMRYPWAEMFGPSVQPDQSSKGVNWLESPAVMDQSLEDTSVADCEPEKRTTEPEPGSSKRTAVGIKDLVEPSTDTPNTTSTSSETRVPKRKLSEISKSTPEEEKALLPLPKTSEPKPSTVATSLPKVATFKRPVPSCVPVPVNDPFDHPAKRLRRAAEVFGYVALGGVAVMSALIATAPAL